MTHIAYSGLFWMQFRVSRNLLTDLTAGKATVRTFLPCLLTAASRMQNCTYRKIFTYQTPQLNLPNYYSVCDASDNTNTEIMPYIGNGTEIECARHACRKVICCNHFYIEVISASVYNNEKYQLFDVFLIIKTNYWGHFSNYWFYISMAFGMLLRTT